MAITRDKIKRLEHETVRLHGELIFSCYFYGVTETYFFKMDGVWREYRDTDSLIAANGIGKDDLLISLVTYNHPTTEPYVLC